MVSAEAQALAETRAPAETPALAEAQALAKAQALSAHTPEQARMAQDDKHTRSGTQGNPRTVPKGEAAVGNW